MPQVNELSWTYLFLELNFMLVLSIFLINYFFPYFTLDSSKISSKVKLFYFLV